MLRIVCLERDTVPARFRSPACPHEWIEYPKTSQADMINCLTGAQVAVVNKLEVNESTLDALPQLRMIAVAATGCDRIALQACRERGVVVSNVQGYSVRTLPEHTMMLMLAAQRHLLAYANDVRRGEWNASDTFCLHKYPVAGLSGATLSIIGKGEIGRRVARLAEAFGMRVLFAEHKNAVTIREGYVALEQALCEADVVSLHCPLNDATQLLIGKAELGRMKKNAVLINTARGGLIDEQALADALRGGVIAGAGVDVLSSEPPRADNPLLAEDIPNLTITPHIAWAAAEAVQALADQVIANIEAFVAGTPRNRVA